MTEQQPTGDQPTEESPIPDDVAAPRGRAWPRVLAVVGVVLAVGVAAAAGVAVGRSTAPGPDLVVVAGPVVEDAPVVETLPIAGPSPVAAAAAALRPTAVAVASGAGLPPAIFTPASELADAPGTASGYRFSSAGISGPQVAGVLAAAFGVTGEVVARDGGWDVGPTDGSGPVLTVNDDPLVSWSFEDAPAAEAAQAGVPPMGDRARELAAALLGTIGVDVESVDWQVDRYDDNTTVTAWQLVDGARSYLAWRVAFGQNDAVVAASGFSAGLEEVPGYPVVGAASAVRRAALPTWAVLGPTPILAAAATEDEEAADATPTPTPTATDAPGTDPQPRPSLTVEMSDVVVTGAELGLAQFTQPDGEPLVLPAYLLTGDDGSRWSLIAVTSEYVSFVDQPYPTDVPLVR